MNHATAFLERMDDLSRKNYLEKNGKGKLFNLLRKTATQISLKNQLLYTDHKTGRTLTFFEELNRSFPIICLVLFERRVRSKSDGIVIRYKEFRRCRDHCPEIFKQFLTPSMYAKMFKDCYGFISPTKFINTCLKILYVFQIRSELGYINPMEEVITYYDFFYWIKNSIRDNSETKLGLVGQLSMNHPNFENFYANYVIERILFFSGSKNSIIKIQDLISSDQFAKFLELRLSDTSESENPFNPQFIFQIFEWFEYRTQSISTEQNFQLSIKDDESQNLNVGNIENKLFLPEMLQQLLMDFEYIIPTFVISRIFEVHSEDCKFVTDSNGQTRTAIGIKTVFKVLFSLEFRESPQSINWFWHILDLNEMGYIDQSVISCFWKNMVTCIEQTYSIEALPLFEHISDEIFDMICPGEFKGKIYKNAFTDSPMAPTVISYLCDPKAFITIEMREEIIAQNASRTLDNNQSSLDLEKCASINYESKSDTTDCSEESESNSS
ncbi:EF-calcium binding domain-containing protein [Cryptosporidium ubiquitum]|uniref:EF-calcium binding domain-containing protein n=1 Tax=Cryptosporidium ubiquitum TaxID=857276 RepID=A0A1J4MKH2_9CRYT|nr:EF-calcium binding domain-containing protein [Cryptosporidium ubiquitum]OII73357.1 EF-calcium binding domain-containing protein [Cryptosporidium ubiquitum]